MRLIPASSALWMTRIESSWSGLPMDVANISAPSAYGLTFDAGTSECAIYHSTTSWGDEWTGAVQHGRV